MKYTNPLWRLLVLIPLSMLVACGGNSGADVQPLPNTQTQATESYTGPPPASEEVQRFRQYVWDNLSPQDRCGNCHVQGGQSPYFVRNDDINLAWAEANTVVTLTEPQSSRLVTKVAGGHHCWLDSTVACADTLTRYIDAWANEAVGQASTITFEAPVVKPVGTSKAFPGDHTGFAQSVYPLLTEHCARCHSETATFAQPPYFASANPDTAYQQAKAKMDIELPANSRFVLRLKDEFHNCWSDCSENAETLRQAIATFADQIPAANAPPFSLVSRALTLSDGQLATSGGRYDENLIARFEFKTGEGSTAYDTSGLEPSLNLTLSGDVTWVGGWGLQFSGGKAQASTRASRKLHDQIQSTGEYSIEAWVAPANTVQEGPATIVSYSAGRNARNFSFGQVMYQYDFRQRMTGTTANGEPALQTSDADEDAQATLQHVVLTFHPAQGRRVYVNGVDTGDRDAIAPGSLTDWDNTYAFVLGNEVSGDRAWQGTLRFLALHNRALSEEQIRQNYRVGVGQRYYLLFGLDELTDDASGYVGFEVSQFDNYSYLFSAPFYIRLNGGPATDPLVLRGLHLGINGHLVRQGQAWTHLNTTISPDTYDPRRGQPLSSIGSIIPIENGVSADEFFLVFEQVGDRTETIPGTESLTPSPVPANTTHSDIGLRTFDEINATMARRTGLSSHHPGVFPLFTEIRQQMPTVPDIETFVSSHQMAITQLAIAYCDALVEDEAQRNQFFAGINTAGTPAEVFDPAGREQIGTRLAERLMGEAPLTTQPDRNRVHEELDQLFLQLSQCNGTCPPDRTRTLLKAGCTAVLGSATTLIK